MLRISFAIVISLFTVSAMSASTARQQLDAFTLGLNGLSGKFIQQTITPKGEIQETSRGTLALKAPRLFRWQYTKPFPQLIVADGSNIWIYDQDLEQVTVRNQSLEEAQTPLIVLLDPAQLDRDFSVKSITLNDDLKWLELTPKTQETSFKHIRIGMNKNQPGRMSLTDLLDNRTEWQFSHWQRNPKLDNKLFTFVPPEGVDVIGEPVNNAVVSPLRN